MRKVLAELKEYRRWIIIAILGIAAATMADLLLPSLFADIATFIRSGDVDMVGTFIKQTGIKMLLVTVGSFVGAIVGNLGASQVSSQLAQKLRLKFFAKVQTFTKTDINQFGTPSLVTRNTNDVMQIRQFVSMFIRVFVRAPIIMVVGIILSYSKNPKLASPLLLSVPLIILVIGLVSRFITPMFIKLQDRIDGINRVFREQISGIRVTRAFGNEDHEEERFDEVSRGYMKLGLKLSQVTSLMGPLLSIVLNLTVVAVLVLATSMVSGGFTMPNGDLLAIVQYVSQILFSFIMISMVFIVYPRAEASAIRLYEVLETKPSIEDYQTPKNLEDSATKGRLEFRNVTFCFPDASAPALEGVSFVVEPGTTTALIGSTGSGKTTALHLILRFYDVNQGSILLDGVDIRELTQHELRSRLGYVPQHWQLFSGTIEENIKFGHEDISEETMEKAAETAQAIEFINQRENRFQSEVAQGGTNFSGGQKQRLAIARAIATMPEVYLFDDSFSALDAKTDKNLRQALAKDKPTTQIIVAQRVASISKADQIVVLDNGMTVGKGTHKELLETCPVYREIAQSQFSEEEVAI